MATVKELLRAEEDGTLSFGDSIELNPDENASVNVVKC